MDDFAKLAAGERKPYLQEAANRRNSTNAAIEKDFWVCWTLRRLFSLQGVPEMRFKGGTSLSKIFKLIHRFSEDIDVSLDRAALGFTGKRDLADKDLSNTQRKALDKELRAAIEKEVSNKILPGLVTSFESIVGKSGWTLRVSEEEGEEMTLLFSYPNAFEYREYLKPQIKIEFGRGDQWPSKELSITPYVAEEFPKAFTNSGTLVSVLSCERTFWEKVTLLHSENHRSDPRTLKPRMSRHWSDIAVMSIHEMFATELFDFKLLEEVVKFKKIYFASNWANYDSACPGTMKIEPNEALHKILREDYKAMREMFISEPLSFDEIIERLKVLETRINSTVQASSAAL
jgi:hypothetical protein